MKAHAKPILAGALLLGTAGAFAWYLHGHPSIIQQLKHLNLSLAVALVLLYSVWSAALVIILQFSLRLYRKTMPIRENILLSAYSNLVNFFGPGQSGPGVRAVYLKKKHGLGIKQFMFASLIYYAFYAIISAGLLFGGSQAWWKNLLGMVATAGVCALVLAWYSRKSRSKIGPGPKWSALVGIFAATAMQLATQCVIFWLEIRAVTPHVGLGQVLSYTGAANFALYVALTPGAIGIREAFLLFTQNLHHLGSNTIVAANLIDRSAYVLFLGVLFLAVLSMHASKKFKPGKNTGN